MSPARALGRLVLALALAAIPLTPQLAHAQAAPSRPPPYTQPASEPPTDLPDGGWNAPPPASGAPEFSSSQPARELNLTLLAGVATVHLSFAAWTYFLWYAKQTKSKELLWNDEGWFGSDTYAGGADKLGHGLGNYVLTRGTAQLLGAAGLGDIPRLLLGNALAITSYVVIEIKDGYHLGFGFSWNDIIANLTGNLIGTAMEIWPALDRVVDIRFEYFPSRDYFGALTDSETNVGEDYSGMRFALYLKGSALNWQSHKFGGLSTLLRYINVGVGYHARGYKPIRRDDRTQTLSLRVALDLQVLLDDYLGVRHRGGGSDATGSGGKHGLVHFASEVLTLPLTSAGVPLHVWHASSP